MAAAADENQETTAAMAAEEFRVWKKNTPYLYDFLLSHALEWPSLTVQWVPSHTPTNTHRLLLGTHTSDSAPNFLMLAQTLFPPPPPGRYSPPPVDPPPSPAIPTLTVANRAPHEGEVNRARHMPQRPTVVATKTCGAELNLFDLSKDSPAGPETVLRGHENEGYGLDWSPLKEGWLLSGSYDSKICLWDVNVGAGADGLDAAKVFEEHKDAVEDVKWHSSNENLFGSVGDDHMLVIWDLRTGKPQQLIEAHEDEVNSVAFNPFNEWILATGSADHTLKLFDLRKLTKSLHVFSSHSDAVLQVEWSPDYDTVLASSSADKRVIVWDLCRIGDEQSDDDAEDGPPELLFVHGGHTAKISEFSWNPNEPWAIASVAEDNILQVWQVAESIYRDDYSTESDGDIYAAT